MDSHGGSSHTLDQVTFARTALHEPCPPKTSLRFPGRLLIVTALPHTEPMTNTGVQIPLEREAARFLRTGHYRVESSLPGMLVLVAAPLRLPVLSMLALTAITFGAVGVLWLVWGVFCPKVSRVTLTSSGGAVVRRRTWHYA